MNLGIGIAEMLYNTINAVHRDGVSLLLVSMKCEVYGCHKKVIALMVRHFTSALTTCPLSPFSPRAIIIFSICKDIRLFHNRRVLQTPVPFPHTPGPFCG